MKLYTIRGTIGLLLAARLLPAPSSPPALSLPKGQREEADLGLYNYGARWYDPALGRFIQPDTIIPNPGDVAAFDRYAYVLNNPLKYSDPTGHQATCTMDAKNNMQCSDNAVTGGQTLTIDLADEPRSNNPDGTGFFMTMGGLLVGSFAAPFIAPHVAALLPAAAEGGTAAVTAACADSDCTDEVTAVTNALPKLGQLQSVGTNVWRSTAGLLYGPDPQLGNRVQHVLKHTVDNSGRPQHGVFTTGRAGTLSVIDQAWQLVQQNSSRVINIIPQGNRTVYEVDMGRPIGYLGGQQGAALGNPAVNILRLVIQGVNQVITAFPVQQ